MPYAEEEKWDSTNEREARPILERYYTRLLGGTVPERIGEAAVVKELISTDSVYSRTVLAQYGGLEVSLELIEFVIERPEGFDVPGFYYDKLSEFANDREEEGEMLKSFALRSLLGQRTDYEVILN